MSADVQRRYLSRSACPIKLVQRGDGAVPLITGYAAVFYRAGDKGTEYEMWPGLVERILPGAFDRAIREDDPRALFDHDTAKVLGRLSAGTLRLTADERGLRYEIDPPDTTVARDLVESIRRGDITGSSFAFLPVQTNHRDEGQTHYVERAEVRLYDVGPVTFPAYAGTAAGIRSAEADLAAVRAEVGRARAARDRDAVAVQLALMDMDAEEIG